MMPIRICMIGAGRVGQMHSNNILHSIPEVELIALVDPSVEVLNSTADAFEIQNRFLSLSAALNAVSFDAVVITSPTFTHKDLTLEASAAGKHVFCEKPMALSLKDCDAMIEAANRGRIFLQIGFMRRFDPEFVAAKTRIDAGEIGEPMLVKSLTHGPGLPPPWARKMSTSNGMIAEVNSHCWDAVRWMMNSNFRRVYAEVANLKGTGKGITDPEFYDNAIVTIKFENDGLGSFSGICPCDYGYDARMEIVGTKGILQIGDLKGQSVLICNNRDHGLVIPAYRSWQQRHEQAYIAEMKHFLECIKRGSQPCVGGVDGRWAVAGVLAATISFQQTRPVELQEILKENA
ncbi:MAG: Gfo/Idh/MocA family oxidoreductase [Anaerolineaceae bacterium]|nr:Gfo/Idh/MocA family oxidoreductase [Anaerolineaceae bacterium]